MIWISGEISAEEEVEFSLPTIKSVVHDLTILGDKKQMTRILRPTPLYLRCLFKRLESGIKQENGIRSAPSLTISHDHSSKDGCVLIGVQFASKIL